MPWGLLVLSPFAAARCTGGLPDAGLPEAFFDHYERWHSAYQRDSLARSRELLHGIYEYKLLPHLDEILQRCPVPVLEIMMDSVLASSVDYSLEDGQGLFELASRLASALENQGLKEVAELRQRWAEDTVYTYPFLFGAETNSCHGSHLKIFVYDVPDNLTSRPLECALGQWGTEVLFHRYLLSSSCRVDDPSDADFFYVPVYGTCLFTKENMQNDDAAADLIWDPLVQHLAAQPSFRRQKQMDHIFLFPDGQSARAWDSYDLVRSEAIFLMVESKCPTWDEPVRRYSDIKPCASTWKDILIPGHTDHARLKAMQRHNRPSEQRELIMTFHGSYSGNKDVYHTCTVRDKIMQLAELEGVDVGGFVPDYFEIKGNSHFCLIPAGTSPWTNQLYESIHCGCIPVILSDEYEVAFQHHLDWRRFSIKWPEAMVGLELYEFLRSFPEEKLRAMKGEVDAHACWFDYFSRDPECSPFAAVLTALQQRKERLKRWSRFWNLPEAPEPDPPRITRFHVLGNESFMLCEVQRLNKEMTGMTEKLERMQAQIAGERSALQQIEELDSALRLSTAEASMRSVRARLRGGRGEAAPEVTRVQTELEAIKKQEKCGRSMGEGVYEAHGTREALHCRLTQEELVRLRSQLQFRESIPSSAVLAEELDAARQDIAAKDIQIRDLQLAGTRTGAQLVEATEKQRQVELQMRRVPEVEAENHQLRSELTQIVSELAAVKETLVKTEEKLRLREAAAPELAAAELLATEAERLEEELADAYAKCATVQAEVKKREDLLRGIPLVLADFLEQIHLPDPVLSSSHAPEDAPRLVIASLQRLQTEVQKREQELKAANEKIAELCEYGAKRDEDVQQEAYDALRAELWDVTQRCAKAEAELEQLGTARERGGGSLIKKMAMLMYNLEVSILSGSGLRDSKWRPGGDGLQCVVDVIGKDEEFQTSSNSTARNPVWNHTGELQMSHSDTLRFAVMGPTKLGEALLPASRIVAAGFEGELTLSEDALLKVKVTVKGSFLLEEGAVRTKAAAKGAAVKAEEAAGPAAGPEAASKAAAKAAATAAAAKAAAAKGAAAKGAAKARAAQMFQLG
ncbi:unnamed protein product [Effrenium voratum]|uniref:Exostosin GT47 domain-containing protein n=2 Tax=Effrenium voratum TaxID=2562239 RepID=A0AA36NDC3_9DINO|nr:unnamed protein product [Effrenium voratum]